MNDPILPGLCLAVVVFYLATSGRRQPQVLRFSIVPDESQIEAGGCLLPIILLLLFLLFLLFGGK